ncbi:uncharacterized protein LOC116195142 isoform X2 [Punica granatum]|uniref:Uncharacterized protein LOC116195142 isoform X2 n=1 Tax=Punica granatum TaxID=22663 RepID=A0A218X1A5_PUNGR|nr:uncharacterized protein LOC116195142 isoform X2 [Punica granatum]OWM78598.1 hypothetical protein CDL15_Pgr002769 [Punica granatum]
MVRFSCFITHIHNHKPKKTGQSFAEPMNILQHSSQIQPHETPLSDVNGSCNKVADSLSLERGWKSDHMNGKLSLESEDAGVHQTGYLKKSKSEGGLHLKGRSLADEDTEDESHETDRGYSFDHSRSVLPDGSNEASLSPTNYEKPAPLDTSKEFSFVNNESIFSIGDPHNSERGAGLEISDARPSGDRIVNSGERTPQTPLSIVRSRSLPNIGTSLSPSEKCVQLEAKSRSSDDLHVLNTKRSEASLHEVKMRLVHEWGRDYHTSESHNVRFENPVEHCDDTFNYDSPAREWIVPIEEPEKSIEYGSSSAHHQWDEPPGTDFKIKRTEEWVIDLQPCFPIEETGEILQPDDKKKREVTAPNDSVVLKAIPGMEAAKRYISSLNPAATAAQLSNHGLFVIPFLSAFVSLKVLNLSGNAIGRITAGALPRGLHVLNLSKNHISAIEGLRELTRLRVLDLSYNRILRIGHGLASCCSLKELYLAGNKIGEVEGLHRLLKLNILDLRFNKISTAKCLGQLAANYNSLQAISLEGNPAQKNVGDEQLKKQLQGLLPQLTYYNRQLIKVGTTKDGADRSVRLGMGSHQIRSDYKSARKGSHGISSKVGTSSGHNRRSHVLGSDRSKGKHVKLPPSSVAKTSSNHHHNHHQLDLGDRLRSLKEKISIRRSRSEGTIEAL